MTATNESLVVGIAAVRDVLAGAAAEGEACLPRGGGTKGALSTAEGAVRAVDVVGLSGIVEYEPSEFTVTALAGTPVAALEETLLAHGQYLPFDPILVEAGATLGGTIAAGLSGSGRVRYGGVRDFVLGVTFLDGEGRLVRGGGKVVKNAAGFDLPKLMVGSLGSLGVLVEATLKVFPAPEATATGVVDLEDLEGAVAGMQRVLGGPCEVDAIDLEPPGRLWIRVAGRERALAPRLERALAIASSGQPPQRSSVGDDRASVPAGGSSVWRGQTVEPAAADAHWRAQRELAWVPPGTSLVKVPLQTGRIVELDSGLAAALGGGGPRVVYGAGGQQALVAWPDGHAIGDLDRMLDGLGLSGLVVRGPADRRRLGRKPGEAALERVRRALDPGGRFRDP